MKQNKIIQIRQANKIFQLTWVINNICTNHCDYCPSVLHTGTNHHYDWEKAKSFAKRLINQHSKIKLAISGGEPTLSPFFPELVDIFYDAGNTIGVTTNGARTVEYWKNVAPKLEYACFSYHPSYHDGKFLEKVLEAANHTQVTIRFMMDSRYWDKAMNFYEECKQYNTFNKDVVRILPEMAFNTIGSDYTKEQLEWLENTKTICFSEPLFTKNNKFRRWDNKCEVYYDDGQHNLNVNPNNLILRNENIFTGWACNIGLESLFIHYDGTVKKANCFQGDILFHINDHEKYPLPTMGEICYQDVCFCTTDILVSKIPIYDADSEIIKKNKIIRFKQQ